MVEGSKGGAGGGWAEECTGHVDVGDCGVAWRAFIDDVYQLEDEVAQYEEEA